MKWKAPEGDTRTVLYCENEWKIKGDKIVSLCKNRNTVVQAGGNIGIFPYYLADYFNLVITYEPIKKNYKCLLENIKSKDNIIAFNYGLGDKISSAIIKREAPGNCGAIRLKYTKKLKNINIIPLDKGSMLENLDLLWLDVEGFEVKALKGAIEHIDKFKPVIVLENNGLVHEFLGDLTGSKELRKWMKEIFNYKLHSRLMRDDIYIPV